MKSLINLDYEIIEIKNHEKIKQEFLNQVILSATNNSFPSVQKSNFGGWQSEMLTFEDFNKPSNALSFLFDPVLQKFYEYTSPLTLRKNIKIDIVTSYWWNVNYKGNFNSHHNHITVENTGCISLFSGTYYLQKPEESGNIVFLNSDDHLRNFFEDDVDDEINLTEGSCLLFSPSKKHYVLPSKSTDIRVSLAFNIHATAKLL